MRPGKRCSICEHPRRSAIERAWIEGELRRNIAARFECSFRQLNNHWARGHVKAAVAAAKAQKVEAKKGTGILNSLEEYRERINRALDKTDEILDDPGTRDVGVILATIRSQSESIREATRLMELGGKITGELDQSKYSLHVLPQWIELRDTLFDALEAFPEARMAVLNAVTARLAGRAQQILPAPSDDEPIEVEVVAIEGPQEP